MQLVLKNNVGKAATLAIGVIVFALLFVWIARAYLATLVSERPTAKNLQAASQLDPSDAEYPLELGRLYQYSAQDIDPDRAIQELTRSAQLNPYDPQTWLDLANAFQLQGEADKAEACMRRADFLAPHLPRFQWAIGNFFLLHNNLDEAFRHFKMVLAANEYQDPIFNTAWKASGDPQKILAELIPKNADQELQYLNYLIASHHWNETEPVWELIAKSRTSFRPPWLLPISTSSSGHRKRMKLTRCGLRCGKKALFLPPMNPPRKILWKMAISNPSLWA